MSQKRISWDVDETRYFLRLIRERQILKSLDGKKFRSEEIFSHLINPMQKRRYLKTIKQMQIRFKTLRRQFNDIKKILNTSGGDNRRNDFMYYEEMSTLIGNRPIHIQDGMDSAPSYFVAGVSNENTPYVDKTNDDMEECVNSELEQVVRNKNSDETISSDDTAQYELPCSSKTTPRKRFRSLKKTQQQLLQEQADRIKENATQLQERQEHFINKLVEKQQQFENSMLQQMLERQKQLLQVTTNQLLTGLKSILPEPAYARHSFFSYGAGPSNL